MSTCFVVSSLLVNIGIMTHAAVLLSAQSQKMPFVLEKEDGGPGNWPVGSPLST
ncbi:hypothetical protein ES703_96254 [subsurface metagenome]